MAVDTASSDAPAAGQVLIVDDNPDNLRVLTGILSAGGYLVRQAPSGTMALRSIKARAPDLVLLDIQMPETNGYEVCRRLKDDPDTRAIPIIFISALGGLEDKLKAFREGGVDYISKPFHAEEVLARARTQLEFRRLQAFAASQAKLAAVGQLAAGIAHEINNPLGFVDSNLRTLRGYIGDLEALFLACERLLEGLPADHAGKAAVQRCQEGIAFDYLRGDMPALIEESLTGSERMRRILADLMRYAPQDEEWRCADLNELVEAGLPADGDATKRRITLQLQPLPPVRCVPDRLRQVIASLVTNAQEATAAGGTVTVRTGHDNDQLWVEVEDDGEGIAPEHMAHLFEPFFTTKPPGRIRGLDLSLSHTIVQAHGGTMHVTSKLGRGTLFRITLPMGAAESVK